VLTGASLGRTFALMRPRDLVWNLWVSSYLMGLDPPANDVLFWSDDTANLPARLHADFLDLYASNPLGVAFLGHVRCDAYVVSGLADHIAPWTAGWRTATGLGGDTTFVAAAGGHIQALLAVPGRAGGGYAAGPPDVAPEAHAWLAATGWREGSWWEHWTRWLADRSGALVDAPGKLGSVTHPVLDDAPGRYVHER
jgi:polyhydroxyalkanoate synthase